MLAAPVLAVVTAVVGQVDVANVTLDRAKSAGAGVFEITSVDAPVRIEGKWRFHAGDAPPSASGFSFARSDFDDDAWELVDVPRGLGEQGHESLVGVYWLRVRLHLDDAVRTSDAQLSVRLGPIDSAYELYVDGTRVGGLGHVDAPEEDAHDRAAIWPIPPSSTRDGDVVLAVRAWRNPLRADAAPARGGMWTGPALVGNTADVVRAQFLRDIDKIIAGSIILVVGLYHLQLFRRRREQRAYLWLGVFCLSMATYLSASADAAIGVLGEMPHAKIFWVGLIMALPTFMQFLWTLLERPIRWWWRLNQAAMTTYALVVIAWPTQWFVIKFMPFFELVLLLPLLVATTTIIVTSAVKKNAEARTLLLGTLALVVAAADNILLERTTWPLPQLMAYAMAALVLSMAVSLANQFARVFLELDTKNNVLVRMDKATRRFVPNDFLSLLGKDSLLQIAKGDHVDKTMSVLFSDLRSFTTLVEKKGPAGSFRFINEYLAHMEPAIVDNGGFVDSFIGDAIMALFAGSGRDAVSAGVAMHRRLRTFSAPVSIGVGINTGTLILGTIGGEEHIKCGVIGDCVNLASRIEGMTKMYGAKLLVSGATRETAPGFVYREVDLVQAKGKVEPVTIFEVLDADDVDEKHATLARFHEALALYRARKFVDARALFSEIAGERDPIVPLLYVERCDAFIAEPPPLEWDAVVKLTSK